MNKYQFITALQKHLTGKVSVEKLQELTNYYNEYIDTEIRKGKSEEEVLKSLGDPRLLAKSVVTAESSDDAEPDVYREYGYDSSHHEQYKSKGTFIFNGKEVPRWKLWVIGIAILIIILFAVSVIFQILGMALAVLFKVVFPILIPVAIIYFLYVLLFEKN